MSRRPPAVPKADDVGGEAGAPLVGIVIVSHVAALAEGVVAFANPHGGIPGEHEADGRFFARL